MNYKEFQQQTIDECHKAGACTGEFKRLRMTVDMNDPAAFIRVLLYNHRWCIEHNIYDAALMLQLDEQDILLRAGLRTQLNVPIDFQPERVAGKLWKPFNEGATGGNWEGDYMTSYDVCAPDFNTPERIAATKNDHIALSTQKRQWSIYQNQFGYLFDGRLFVPAGGYKEDNQGEAQSVGNEGSLWSASVTGTIGVNLNFHYAGLSPSNANYRAYGFQVRCLQE